MRWVLFILAFLACTTICWSKGKNSPNSVARNKNYPDRDEAEECGRIQIRIKRNTGPFRRLINHPSRSKRLKSDSADHFYVSNRLKLIIDRLILLIASDDVIFIVRGWRNVIIQSDGFSLSYEGRSIRFRYAINNVASRLRALAGLAIDAGCDWVRNDDDENVTCSVKPDDCRVPTDLTFMLDTSGSVGRYNHKKALSFIYKVVSYFNIGPNATQVALVPFATYVHSYFFLRSFSDKSTLLTKILSTRYSGGWTRTWKAMSVANKYVYNTTKGLGARPKSSGVPRIAVILTDGRSNGRNAIPYVNRLKDEGVIVFSVGIGGNIDNGELNEFASEPDVDHVFLIDSYTDIEDFVNRLSTYTCKEPGVTDPGNNTEVELPEDDFRYFQGMCSSYNQSNRTITIEETDIEGSCSVYVSTDPNNRNPGPLTDFLTTYSNTSNTIIKHITLPSGINTTLVYISLRGTGTMNRCTVTIYDSLFNRTEYSFSLQEGVYNNRTLGTLLAEFRSGGFEYRYSIIPERDHNFFDIDSYSGTLTVSGSFDREERSEYRASILVEDPRISCLKGRTTVILIISDANDSPPIFLTQSYTASVLETANIDSSVTTVSATDQDSGMNAFVTYNFGSSPAPSADFGITSDGVVFVSGSLDGFTTPSYEYTVVATDGGQPSMTGTATLTIAVEQVNSPPTFTVCPSGTCKLSIAEDAGLEAVGLILSATDPDTGGLDAQLTYSGGNSLFEINSTTGDVRLTSSLDRETVASYTLEFVVSDGGTPSLSDTVRVEITVTDVNDNPPVFDPQSYSSVLTENSGPTVIFEVKATDIDEGSNAEINYSLNGNYPQYFSVDASGVVSTVAAIDFENIPSNPLQFLITASNPGGVYLVNALGSLQIRDVNDNSPVISGDTAATLPENSPMDTLVFNLTVSDADSGSNGDVSVELVEGNQNGQFALIYTDMFAIVRLRLSLDFETSRSHSLKFRATDGGDPARITSLDLTLSVGDINDNSPVCISDVSNTLQEDVPIGTQVGQVTASDGDRPNTLNSQISYNVTAVNNTQDYLYLFSVDSTGVVTTNGTLDIELSPQYIISVTASDSGDPAMSCVALVTLTLQDVNEFPPVINNTASVLNISIREDTPVYTVIAFITATDPDFAAGNITYALASQDFFSIDSNTGNVRVSSPLDFEITPSYQLTVIATDGENEQTAILSVRVINVNDVTPSTNISSPVEVSEAAPVSAIVLCFSIEDADGDANGEFSVTLSGSGANLLEYNSTTSCIFLTQALDREGDLGDNIQVMVTVNDNGEPNLHSTTEFRLVILDANDNPPVFPTDPLLASVSENTAIGTPVRSVVASDRDTGLNSQIIYSINSTQFAIGSTSGEITVNGSINFESTPVIMLQVTARDLGDPSLSATVLVIVSVTDVNDNVPQLTNLPSTVNRTENGDLSSTIFEVTSSDLDTDSDSVNRQYSIPSVSPNNIPNFSINPDTGLITADANQFDREGVPSYTLTISVSDGSNSDREELLVIITDVNDNPPTFIGDLKFSIRECELNCDNIFKVETTDNDQPGTYSSHISSVFVFNTNSFTASLLLTNTINISCNNNSLDFERTATESFILQATDGGNPPLSANATIQVNIIDCNDNPPILSPAVISVSLSEDTQVETVVANFNATDVDTGPAGVITYRQIEQGSNFFAIDATSGEVTLIRALDFETQSFHYFNIIASDSGSPSISRQGSLHVTVVNVNDNLPVFEPAQYTLDLPEDTLIDYVYNELRATDADGDRIEFSVVGTSPFMIIPNTSNLTLVTNLDFETQSTYSFFVYASNPGSTGSVSAAVMLNVQDVNDNNPIFTNNINMYSLDEDTQVETFVFTATAQDLDSGVNGMFSFFFDTDLDEFDISSSGSVTTAMNLDREFRSLYILTVIVRDMGNPALSSTMNFTVQISDVNDNMPEFEMTPYSDSIYENAVPGTLLSRVIIATDIDLGMNSVVDLTDNSAEFDVLSNGSVSLATILDFELRNSYTFTVIATDRGTPALSNSAVFTVQVLNVNDNSPVFSPSVFQQTLVECNQLTYSCLCQGVVFTALATDADNDMLTYSLQVTTSTDIFSINSATGSLTASCEVDREVDDMFEIVITAFDGMFTALATLSITISDVNDNIPYFSYPNMVIQVGENTPLSTEIASIDVTDRDIGLNGAVELSIQLVHPADITSVVSISQDGRISLSAALDFESVTEYRFLINATDRGYPRLQNTTTFTLNVTDFNDNPPIFDRSNYSIYVHENSPPQVVLCVSAVDIDSGANSQLTYFILNSTQVSDELESAFTFDGCNLTTLRSFDFEGIQQFTIFIGARDAGSPTLSAIIPVFVQILDLNDNDPMFEGDYPNPLQVSENTPIGNAILTVRATDADSGANGEVSFTLYSATFNVTADGFLRTRTELDFESIQTYYLSVMATDSGSPPRSSYLNFTVQVVNVNDNTPVFNQSSYSFFIPENSNNSTFVGETPATDADSGVFGDLTYSIASDPNNIIIYPVNTSYELFTLGTLDRETISSYSLRVQVQDGGSPPLYDTADISITVLDVNDNAPTFDNNSVEVMIRENVPLGTLVAELHATDRDEPNTQNSLISFSTNDTRFRLQTDSTNGVAIIFTNSSIDRETQSVYVILITATDNGDSPLSSSAYVTVVVLDLNDNSPVFTDALANITLPEDTPTGTLVATFNVLDSDSSSQISYTIQPNGTFSVNSSGSVFLSSALNFEFIRFYNLTVIATDNSNPVFATLLVFVTDVNEFSPSFQQNYTASILENKPQGATVQTVVANDSDSGQQLVYAISGERADEFQIGPSSGVVTTRVSLDREDSRGSVITLLLQVTDSGTPTLVGFATLTLNVLDENDNSPQFVNAPPATLTLPEDTPALSNVTQILATDADTGPNAEITYSIQGSSLFETTQTGQIQLTGSLDFELEQEYRLVVIATDGGDNPRFTNATIVINVTDVNDNAPTFQNTPYKTSVDEHSDISTILFTAVATDRDFGINSQLVFSVSDNPYFSINQSTGALAVAGVIDRELVDTINVTVTVCDRGVPNLCASEVLCVTVTDINDQNPMFGTQQSQLILSEGPARTNFVFQAIAIDNDDPNTNNSRIVSYSIFPAASSFTVNSQGQVFAPDLDFETTLSYQLTITATDGGSPPLSGSRTLNVEVTDINDNAPILSISPGEIEVPENQNPSTLNLTIEATDLDSGANGEVTFLLQESNTPFTLSPAGILFLSSMLDFDTGPQSFSLTVVASDNGSPSMSSSGTLVVRVGDVNDNFPTFNQSSYETSITEGQIPDFPVLEVSASDADFNSQVSYSLSDISTFSIDSSGRINGIVEIDFEETPRFDLNVIATDNGTPPRSIAVPVTVNIIDINDNAPRIVTADREVNVSESSEPPRLLLTFSALDLDSGQNGEIFFTLDSSSSKFSLDDSGNTSELNLFASLDFEMVQSYPLYITAHDRGDPELNTTITVVVNIINENDNAPIFIPAAYNASVREDQQPSFLVTTVRAQDLDLGVLGMIDYSLANNFFSINDGGFISLMSTVDAESVTFIELSVTACDRGYPPRCATAPVSVSIIDANDNSPQITSPSNGDTVLIPESYTIGTTVAVAVAIDSDRSAPNNLISYAITTASNDGLDLFAINNLTGVVRLTNSLDFEVALMRLFNLTVTVSDQGFPSLSSTVSFQIRVTDVNDNPPVLTNGPLTITVEENLSAHLGPQFNATDADTGINARILFSISGSGQVSINQDTGVVTLNGPFDFEDTNVYNFTVTATDQGSPSLSDTTYLIVHILDTNDNPPNFSMDLYTESIPENTSVNQTILTVSAEDVDGTADNNVISYSIYPNSQTNFLINGNGEIYLTQMLDFETLSSQTIQFSVVATDNGNPALSSTTIVRITVTDSNDNSPQIGPLAGASILEGSSIQTVLITVQATDADSGLNAALNYSIVNADSVPFSISDKGTIFVNGAIDRESQDSYVLTVLVQDNGSPSLSTQVTVNVAVLDINDNPPMFLSLPYAFYIPENVTIDTTLGSIDVTDRDIGINANLSCYLSGIGSDRFHLLSNNVIVIALLDRETVASYSLIVTCQDSSPSPLISHTNLSIIVTDINDNSPQFPNQQYTFEIREDVNPYTEVGQLQASDLDDPNTPNAQIEFSITTGNGEYYFSITPGGLLRTNNTAGRIPVFNFTLTITATDGGIPPLSNFTIVIIRVIDVNDVAPSFNTSNVQTIRISEYTPVGENIANFTATDLEGSTVTYSLRTDSGTAGDFRVDSVTGGVFVNGSLDFERDQTYTIVITAVDNPGPGEGPPRTGLVSIPILVIDENDNSPIFDPDSYQPNINENVIGPLPLATISATDRDSGANGMISYSISLPTALVPLLAISPTTGVVSLLSGASFDYEGVLDNQFDITVIATDNGTPSNQNTALLTISIIDVNDNSPQIPDAYTAVIIEGVQVGTFLIRVQATDLDTGLNGEIVYSLVQGETAPFEINSTTGDISSTLVLDRENISSYNLIVSATDRGIPSLSNTTVVTVVVQDENDNCPIITNSNTGETIFEGSSGEVLQSNFLVTDLDIGLNGEFNYSIADPALRQIFRIDSATGQLNLLQTLDRESVPQYNLTVLITDRGIPACTTTTFVVIDVLDENDNRPIFIGTPFVANISEGVPLNTLVICVNATDADVGVNAQFSLQLVGNVPFTLNAATGCIFTAGELDRETNPQFSFTVSAIEASDSQLSSTATVLVNLLDRNDVTPRFTTNPYIFTVTNPEITAVIGVLVALDEDEGLNGQLSYNYSLSESTNVLQTYIFSVSDMGIPSLSSATSVMINFPNCENLEISTTNTNNQVDIFINTLCSATVELVSTFTVVNSSVTLDCNVVANLPFTVEWFRNADPLQGPSTETGFTIDSLTEADEGSYTCRASNSELSVISNPYSLTVQIPPEITIPPKNLAINSGDTLNLTCYSIGVPNPEHQWSLISSSLENGFVVLPSEDAPGFSVSKNQIILPVISVEYEGSYSCNASNVVGHDVASGEVIIHAPSDIVTIGLPSNFSNPDPNNNGCNDMQTPLLEGILGDLTDTLSLVTSISGDSNLCDTTGGTTTTTTTDSLCIPNPCNGYACTLVSTELSGFFCECPVGLDGPNCNLDVDECSQPDFCQNGGTCLNVFNGFSCNCVPGYTGETCEIPLSCNETSCPDGQMCVDTVDSFNCLVTQNVTVNTTNEQSADNVASTANNEAMNVAVNRRRRQTGSPAEPAYRNCTVLPFREPGSTVVILIIGCLEGFTLSESDYSDVCQTLYDSFANFRTCSTPSGVVIFGPKTPPTPGVTISLVLRDPTSREVIPGSTAVILINDRLNDASTNNTLIRQLVDLGFPEPDLTQISVSSPPLPVIPPDYTAAIIIILLILLILVLIAFCLVLVCVCLRRRSREDKVTSYDQSVHQQPVSKPEDLEQGPSVEMRDVSTEQPPENDYGIVEQAVAVTTTFSNPNAVETEEQVQAPAKPSLASKFSFKKDNAVKEDKESLVSQEPIGTTEATNTASCNTDSSKKPELGKKDSLPRRILAATTSFGKKKEHCGIDATPLIDDKTGSKESLSDPVPEPLPEKLPPKKKTIIEPQSPTINERELVAGALVPVTERDREYDENEKDMYYNVEVKANATMAQLWETAVKDEKQEKKMIAGKKLITVQSQEDIQSGPVNTEEQTAEPTVKSTEPTAKPTGPTDPVVPETSQSVPQLTSPVKKSLTEKVEQTLSYPWYHSDLDREGAEIKLMQLGNEGAFLVRAASSSKGDYSLSVLVSYKEPLIKHLLIKDNGSELVLQSSGGRNTFPHLAALVAYYSKEVFVFSDWQRTINLLYPVPNQ